MTEPESETPTRLYHVICANFDYYSSGEDVVKLAYGFDKHACVDEAVKWVGEFYLARCKSDLAKDPKNEAERERIAALPAQLDKLMNGLMSTEKKPYTPTNRPSELLAEEFLNYTKVSVFELTLNESTSGR